MRHRKYNTIYFFFPSNTTHYNVTYICIFLIFAARRMDNCSVLFSFFFFLATKESDGESKDEEDANGSDASSSSQNQQNGDVRSSKQRTSRQAAKNKGNGE